MIIVSLYSVAGGVGRTTLAVALAVALKARGVEPVVVEGDFEGASLFHLVDRWAPNARDLYTLTLWGFPVTPGDLSVIRVGGYEVKALVIDPNRTNLVDLTTRVAAAWGTVSTARATLRRRLRRVLESAAEAAGASVVLLDARSGLAVPSLDILASSNIAVVLSRPDPMSLARTAVALKQIGEELREMKKHGPVYLQRATPVISMTKPQAIKEGEPRRWLREALIRLTKPVQVQVDEPVELPLVLDMIESSPLDFAENIVFKAIWSLTEEKKGYAHAVNLLADLIFRYARTMG